MYKDKFVLSVICNGNPVKEGSNGGIKEVVIPFDSEYKLRLKNKNERDCTAKVTIDGVLVSSFGDIIISAGSTVDLERFITGSMVNGKKFKFVTLDHPDVDDPTKTEIGIIKVEFKLAKKKDIKIDFDWKEYNKIIYDYQLGPYFEDNNGPQFIGPPISSTGGLIGSAYRNDNTVVCSSNNIGYTEVGATIEGSNSNQSFTYSSLDVESNATILKLKMVGIKNNNGTSTIKRFCNQCGNKIKTSDRYCSRCGYRL